MAGEDHIVLTAPVLDGLIVGLFVLVGEGGPVVEADLLGVAAAVEEQLGQLLLQIVAVALPEDLEHLAGPGDDVVFPAGLEIDHGGLVGEEALHLGEVAAQVCLIPLVGVFQELLGGLGVQDIGIPAGLPLDEEEQLPGALGGFPGDDLVEGERRHQVDDLVVAVCHILQLDGAGVDGLGLLQVVIPGVGALHEGEELTGQVAFAQLQVGIGQLGVVCHQGLAAGAAGPVVFVVDPDLQAHLLGLLDGELYPVQPVLVHVAQLFPNAEAGMDVETGAALVFIFFQLISDLVVGHFAVPEPEGHDAEFHAGVGEFVNAQRLAADQLVVFHVVPPCVKLWSFRASAHTGVGISRLE